MKHQNPDMSYILAPEPHPKSGRIHFHGIFRNVPNWVLKEARNPHTNRLIKRNGLQIYNYNSFKSYESGSRECIYIKIHYKRIN